MASWRPSRWTATLYRDRQGPGPAVARCRSTVIEQGVRRMSDIILALRKATKLYAGVPAIEDVDFELRARRDSRAGRRERRRQIDADQGDGGRRHADLRDDAASTASTVAPRTPLEARHLGIAHGVPGEQPGADDDGRAEPVSRPGALLQSPARHLHRRAAIPAVAEFRRHADRDRRRCSAPPRSRWSRSRARCCTRPRSSSSTSRPRR